MKSVAALRLVFFLVALLIFMVARDGCATVYSVRVGRTAHQKFGLSYPVTYKFRIPTGAAGLAAEYKYSDPAPWMRLPQQKSGDIFNGIDAVRFDPSAGFAYLSARFSTGTDTLYFRVLDGTGHELDISFESIPRFYDDRTAAVAITIDDYGDWSNSAFNTAADILVDNDLRFSVGVITGQVYRWSLLQDLVNRSGDNMEISSHSVGHYCDADSYAASGYDNETARSRDALRNALTFSGSPFVPLFIEPCGYSDAKLAAAVTSADYLVSRSVDSWYSAGSTFASWDPLQGRYERAATVFNDYGRANDVNLLSEANGLFDRALADGAIYHLLDHPALGLWRLGSPFVQHLDYIKGRHNVWYVPFGQMYQYHFLQEMHGNLSIETFVPGTPAADIMAAPMTGRAPLTVDFTDTSSGQITGWQWDFGDGTTSGERNPVHTYTSSGIYTATLVVTDGKLSSSPATATIDASLPYSIGTTAIGDGSVVCTPGTLVDYRTRVSCSVFPGPDSRVAEVTVDGNGQFIPDPNSFTWAFAPVTADHAIVATFAPITYTVTFVSGGKGSLAGSLSQSIDHGGSTTAVTAVPGKGYRFAGWTGPGGFTSTANPLVLSDVTASQTVTATFVRQTFRVEFAAGANGSVTGTAVQSIDYGGSTTAVTAVPAAGYRFLEWSDTDGFTSTANPLSVNDVTSARVITATFAPEIFNVTFAAGANGTVTGKLTQAVNSGASTAAVTAVPASGFRFVNWTGSDDFTSTGNPLVIATVMSAMSVTANFAPSPHTVTPQSGAWGTLTPGTPQQVAHEGAVSFSVTPATGYRLTSVSGCGGTLAGSTYTTAPIIADCSITATFTQIAYSVTGSVGGGRGWVSCVSPVPQGGKSGCAIVPAAGYELSSLADNGVDVTAAVKEGSYVIGAVAAEHTVTAVFSQVTYTLVDALRAQQQGLGKVQLPDTERTRLDVAPLGPEGYPQPDGVVDVADVVIMLRRLVGAITW